ncbi:hypothetical protein LOD68_10155, partial [Xylella fastidiosa subsp. multiplex]
MPCHAQPALCTASVSVGSIRQSVNTKSTPPGRVTRHRHCGVEGRQVRGDESVSTAGQLQDSQNP